MGARPLIVAHHNVVIAGNMRLVAAERLGWTHVPVVYLDLDAEDPRAVAISLRDNNHYGEWDDTALPELLYELAEMPDFDLAATGFSEADAQQWLDLSGASDLADDAPLPASPGHPDTEVWVLRVRVRPHEQAAIKQAMNLARSNGADGLGAALAVISSFYLASEAQAVHDS